MNKEVTYDSLNKRDIAHNIHAVQSIKELLLMNDKEFAEAFYMYVDMEDLNNAKEIKLKNIKKVLNELSIKFGYDLEPAKELINVKHSHLNGISYPILKECLFEWLEKQEKILSTSILVQDRDVTGRGNLDDLADEKEEEDYNHENSGDYNFNLNFDVNMIILHRSLYILKRKFEIFDKEIYEIYRKYSAKDVVNMPGFDLDYAIDLNARNFVLVVDAVMKASKFSLAEINKPSDLYRAELVNQINRDKVKAIIRDIDKFMTINREKYNKLMKERKEKRAEISKVEISKAEISKDEIEKDEIKREETKEPELKEKEEVIKPEENENKPDEDKPDSNGEKDSENKENPDNSPKENLPKDDELIENPDDKVDNKIEENELLNSNDNQTDPEYKVNIIPPKEEKDTTPTPSTPLIPPNVLLIEILPLIIADYVQENGSVVIIDIDPIDYLKHELRTLFDNEILQRLGEVIKYNIDEEKTSKLKDLLLERLNLEKNIRIYEDLLVKKIAVRENTVFIEQMLKKLKNSKVWLDNKIKVMQEDNETINNYETVNKTKLDTTNNHQVSNTNLNASGTNRMDESSIYRKNNISKIIPRKYLTKEELRMNALKEIFYFYSRQHQLAGSLVTFDDISSKTDHMDLGEFMKFCVEFKILVKKERLVEVFKKTSSNTRNMTFDEFLLALRSISVRVNDEKKDLLIKRINRLKNEMKKFGVNFEEGNKKIHEPLKKKVSIFGVNPGSPKNIQNNLNKNQDGKPKDRPILEEKNESDPISNTEVNKENSDDPVKNNIEEEEKVTDPLVNPEANSSPINDATATPSEETISPMNNPSSPKTTEQKKKIMKRQSLIYSSPMEIQEEIPKFKMMLQELKNKSYQQLLEEFYLYLEIDSQKVYRCKMKGFILPFHSHDKMYRIPNDDTKKKNKKLDARTTEEIKRILQERRDEKEKAKVEKERLEKLKYFEQRKKLHELNEKLKKEKQRVNVGKESNYAVIKKKHEIFEKEKDTKLTWDQLENLNSNFFISNREDDFNPEELIGDLDYDSDDADLFLNIKKGMGQDTTHGNVATHNSVNSKTKNNDRVFNYNNSSLVQATNNVKKVGSTISPERAETINKSFESNVSSGPGSNINNKSRRNKSPTQSTNHEYHDHSYFMEKSQKKMKELEKEWEEKQVKIIEKYDNMVKKSQEKVSKHKNKKY